MGQVLANDWDSYQYFVESIRQFPQQKEFAMMIEGAGFEMVKYTDYSLGICSLHDGFKLWNNKCNLYVNVFTFNFTIITFWKSFCRILWDVVFE